MESPADEKESTRLAPEPDGPANKMVLPPGSTTSSLRWLLLIILGITIATNYYAYDALSSIKEVLQQALDLTSMDYGLIISFYSFPNTFLLMAIFGGMFLDKYGIRRTGFIFLLFCALGVLLTAYGASDVFRQHGLGYALLGSFLAQYSPELKLMIAGRLLFGLGAETSIVVINKIIANLFKGKELAFAFAINLAIARLGTAAALILSPILVEAATGWTTALWVAGLLMTLGFLLFLVYIALEKKAIIASPSYAAAEASEVFSAADVLLLLKNKPFILISLLCVTFYSAVFPFQAFCPDLLHHKFGLSLKLSGTLSSMIIWGTIIFTPLFGWFVDKKGRRASLMIYGSALLLISHLLLAFTTFSPLLAMFVLGIAFSLVPAAMWPSVPLIVEENRLGTAYGVMTAIQNLGLWAFPILAGWITDRVNSGAPPGTPLDYTYTVFMFACLGLIGLFFAFALRRADSKTDLEALAMK